ncbi:unnamed protein product, partial [Pocillopora meandrina]
VLKNEFAYISSRILLENFLTITSPPILLRVLLEGKIVCVLNYRTSVLFSVETQPKIKKLFNIKSWFGVKDPIPAGLRSRIIY